MDSNFLMLQISNTAACRMPEVSLFIWTKEGKSGTSPKVDQQCETFELHPITAQVHPPPYQKRQFSSTQAARFARRSSWTWKHLKLGNETSFMSISMVCVFPANPVGSRITRSLSSSSQALPSGFLARLQLD